MRRLVVACLPFLLLLSGCVDDASGPETWTFERPQVGGSWDAVVSGPDGESTTRIHLEATTERLSNGQEEPVPVLRFEWAAAEGTPSHRVHILGPNGTFGSRGPASVTFASGLTSPFFAFDEVVFDRNVLTGAPPDWGVLGPALWGQTLAVGEERVVSVTTDEARGVEATWRLEAIEDGCAVVRTTVPGGQVAEATFCDDVFPERVHYSVPADVDVILTRTASGAALPPPVEVYPLGDAQRIDGPGGAAPPRFPLDGALAAARADPRASDWFAERPDAFAVSGALTTTVCPALPGDTSCPLRNLPGPREVFTWTLTWGAPDEAGLTVQVAKAASAPPAAAQVVDVEEVSSPGTAMLERIAPIDHAHGLWSSFVNESFTLVGVEFDLMSDRPQWVFRSRLAPTDGQAVAEWVQTTFEVSMDTGLVTAGFVASQT